MSLKILLVDDYFICTEFYKTTLSKYLNDDAIIDCANNLKDAFKLIFNASQIKYDVIVLDLMLHPSDSSTTINGEDLAKKIRWLYPEIKIMIITDYSNTTHLSTINKTLLPDSLIAKKDIDNLTFIGAFNKIINDGTIKSKFIKEKMNDNWKSQFYLDPINLKIIELISQGKKSKEIQQELNLSKSAIDKRKSKIKQCFEMENGNNVDIVNFAKRNGLL